MMRPSVKMLPGPSTRRRYTAVNAIVTMALQNAPAKNHQPNSVECHSGDSDITRSKASNEYTKAKQIHTAGARRRILGGGIRMSPEVAAHLRASSLRDTSRNDRLRKVITASAIPSRAKRNGTLSHVVLAGIGCRIQGKINSRPKNKNQNST